MRIPVESTQQVPVMRALPWIQPGTTRSILNNILVLLQVISACFMTWKALSFWADTPHPIMVVTTESMVPAFRPGDIMFVTNRRDPDVRVGDLPVCWFSGHALPMMHRVVRVLYQEHEDPNLTYV